MPENFDGCAWPLDATLLPADWEATDLAVRDRAVAMATLALRRLTGYRVGGCPITVRPVPQSGRCWAYDRYPITDAVPASAYVWGRTPPKDPTLLRLPPPIGSVQEVMEDGVVLTSDQYRIEGGTTLRRLDGVWLQTQNVALSANEVGTLQVTYTQGYPVDAMGSAAVTLLAVEFTRALTSSKKCALPSGVQNIIRQGVSMEVTAGLFPDSRTGIRLVDGFIETWNPGNLRQAPRVYSPDIPRPVTVAHESPGQWVGGGSGNQIEGGTP